jgi:hypothetical protein
LKPFYYEINGKSYSSLNSTENECENKCFDDPDCIQYVFNINNKTCNLKKSLNISNGIPVKLNPNLLVKNIKSKKLKLTTFNLVNS